MKAASLGLLIGATSLAVVSAIAAPGAKAACLTSDLIGFGTDCVTFEAGQTATAKIFFASPNLSGTSANTFWQIGASTTAASSISLTNLKWSNSQNGTFQSLLSGSLAATTPTPTYTSVQLAPGSSSSPVPTGSPFWIQYDIPAGLAVGEVVDVQFLSNSDGAVDSSGILSNSTANQFYGDTRTNTAAIAPTPSSNAAPGPLPLLGAGAAFGASRRLRRRLRSAA